MDISKDLEKTQLIVRRFDEIFLEKASKITDTKHFRRYPVVDNGALVGLVTENSIVQALNDNIKFHRNLQNAIVVIFVVFELFVFVLYKHLINLLA